LEVKIIWIRTLHVQQGRYGHQVHVETVSCELYVWNSRYCPPTKSWDPVNIPCFDFVRSCWSRWNKRENSDCSFIRTHKFLESLLKPERRSGTAGLSALARGDASNLLMRVGEHIGFSPSIVFRNRYVDAADRKLWNMKEETNNVIRTEN
jgi:hypothetical protein